LERLNEINEKDKPLSEEERKFLQKLVNDRGMSEWNLIGFNLKKEWEDIQQYRDYKIFSGLSTPDALPSLRAVFLKALASLCPIDIGASSLKHFKDGE